MSRKTRNKQKRGWGLALKMPSSRMRSRRGPLLSARSLSMASCQSIGNDGGDAAGASSLDGGFDGLIFLILRMGPRNV